MPSSPLPQRSISRQATPHYRCRPWELYPLRPSPKHPFTTLTSQPTTRFGYLTPISIGHERVIGEMMLLYIRQTEPCTLGYRGEPMTIPRT